MADPLPPAQDPTEAHLETAATMAGSDPEQALVHAVIALVHEQRRVADRLDSWNNPREVGPGKWRGSLWVAL